MMGFGTSLCEALTWTDSRYLKLSRRPRFGFWGLALRGLCQLSCLDGAHRRLDPVGDPLLGLAKLFDGPVCRLPLRDIVGPGVVDQPLGERGVQHQFTLGDGDEAIGKPVETELRSARLANAGVEVMQILDMAGGAGGGG